MIDRIPLLVKLLNTLGKHIPFQADLVLLEMHVATVSTAQYCKLRVEVKHNGGDLWQVRLNIDKRIFFQVIPRVVSMTVIAFYDDDPQEIRLLEEQVPFPMTQSDYQSCPVEWWYMTSARVDRTKAPESLRIEFQVQEHST